MDKNSVSMGYIAQSITAMGNLRYTLVKITDRGAEMQIIKGIAIAAVLIIAGLLALIVAAYLAFRIAAAIFEQQESWKDSGSRKGRNMIEKLNTGYSRKARTVSAAAYGADTTIYAAGTYWEMQDYKARKQ